MREAVNRFPGYLISEPTSPSSSALYILYFSISPSVPITWEDEHPSPSPRSSLSEMKGKMGRRIVVHIMRSFRH